MKRTITILSYTFTGGLCLLILLAGCQQQKDESQKPGYVEANQAYLDNFGPPPQGKQGRGFARVGYLPEQAPPGKLRPIPLFLFSEDDQMQKIFDRLVSGELVQSPQSPLYNPFPADIDIDVKSLRNGTLNLSLTTQKAWPADNMAAAGRALAETGLQYTTVHRVRILLNDELFPKMPAEGFQHDPQQVAEAGPPELVMLAGSWDKGSELPREILAEFNRPVKVNSFHLYETSGSAVDGDYFTSVFQMAVVIHPENPERYQEGSVLRAEWDVVDDLGRSNQGTNTLPLKRYDH